MSHSSENQYLDLLKHILDHGVRVPNRTGTDTLVVLSKQCDYDLSEGFPLFTSKRVWFKGVKHELLWFLSGSTHIKYLVDNGVNIWNDDAFRHYRKEFKQQIGEESSIKDKENFINWIRDDGGDKLVGELGPVYGKQWRHWGEEKILSPWPGIDQVANLISGIKKDPYGRRHILNAWNVAEIPKMGLPPCHVMSIFSVLGGKLHCHMTQRSCDMFLGVPFNVASYSLFVHMIAQVCGLEPGIFSHSLVNAHIYVNHIDAVREQLDRPARKLPTLELAKRDSIDDFKYEDIKIVGYNPHPTIQADLVT